MFPEIFAWLIIGLPIGSFVLNGTVIRLFVGSESKISGWLTIGSIAGSFVISIWALISVASHGVSEYPENSWIAIQDMNISFGILLDQLSAIMLVVVSGVSLIVQFYSQQYMHGDKSYTRFYTYMSLFTASMLGLVLSRHLVQIFVFWELVGVSSYLLIGFWMDRPSAAAAAKKAFLMTRFGDFGLLLVILYIFSINPLWLDVSLFYEAIVSGEVMSGPATWIALGLFLAAVGKSAQFPLHSWLPDAMEGPTSVSALIHSATMVTAGVFLVARFFPIFETSNVLDLVALVGAFTALFAALIALTSNDIKRVLAYSTISQLGYMMLALGIGAYAPAIFHLFTHAFFKASLFLGAGSVHHATGTFNMRFMGGLKNHMKLTYATMLISSLSLSGLFPLSGFWSKDEILAAAAGKDSFIGYVVLIIGLIVVVLTAFYMFRVIFMTFHGEYRGGAEKETEEAISNKQDAPIGLGQTHLQESPWVMVIPLVILSSLAIIIGYLVNPLTKTLGITKHAFSMFLVGGNEAMVHAGFHPEFNIWVAVVSTIFAVSGIAFAYFIYISGQISLAIINEKFKYVQQVLTRNFYFDELYEDFLVNRIFYGYIVRFSSWFDVTWVDNINVYLARLTTNMGSSASKIQNGQAQAYAAIMLTGVVILIFVLLIWN